MNEYYSHVLDFAKEAGEVLLDGRERGFGVDTKGGDYRDMVSEVDLLVNDFLIQKIKNTFPGHSIYSEEIDGGDVLSESYMWAIDPIDGTSNFIRDIPHFAISIGLLKDGVPLVGAVYNPITKELFSFSKGNGIFLNGEKKDPASKKRDLSQSYVLITGYRHEEVFEWGNKISKEFLMRAKKVRNLGSTALDTCFVAFGRVDLAVYGRLSVLDNVASLGFLREAGGDMFTPEGEVASISSKPQRVLIVRDKDLLSELMEFV